MMVEDVIENVVPELIEITDRINSCLKDKKITDEQKASINVASSYIYLGVKKLNEVLEE